MSITESGDKSKIADTQYYKRYTLLKDTPSFKSGWPIKWDGSRRRYFFSKPKTWGYNKGEPDIYLDYNGQSFTREEIESKPEWFKPEGEPTDFVPPFPKRGDLDEYVHLTFETRLVDDVDICRALNDLFDDKEFQESLYDWVKYKYEQFHVEEELPHA